MRLMNLLTVSEVARLLGTSAQNVVRMANVGHLPVAVTLSTGERLFDATAVEQLQLYRNHEARQS
jgi:excisionase family DNA binding protein